MQWLAQVLAVLAVAIRIVNGPYPGLVTAIVNVHDLLSAGGAGVPANHACAGFRDIAEPGRRQFVLSQHGSGTPVVTLDGKRHELGASFTVVATQNPIEQQGAYPLPEAQLDRFLFKHVLSYPSIEEEKRIVATHGERTRSSTPESYGVGKVLNAADLRAAIDAAATVKLTNEVIDYVVKVVRATREVGIVCDDRTAAACRDDFVTIERNDAKASNPSSAASLVEAT